MPCNNCKKKGIPMDCKYCPGKFCSTCINLEKHDCEGLVYKLENCRKLLEKKLIPVVAPKVVKI